MTARFLAWVARLVSDGHEVSWDYEGGAMAGVWVVTVDGREVWRGRVLEEAVGFRRKSGGAGDLNHGRAGDEAAKEEEVHSEG